MNSWIIRPCPKHSIDRINEFLNEGFIAIDWPPIGDLKDRPREEIMNLLMDKPFMLSGSVLGYACATINIFKNQMRKGDFVLMPYGNDIYIGLINSDYYFESSSDLNHEGYVHRRKINWLSFVWYNTVSKELQAVLKLPRAVGKISECSEEIEFITKNGKLIANSSGLCVPNKETLEAMQDVDNKTNLSDEFSSVKALMDDFNN